MALVQGERLPTGPGVDWVSVAVGVCVHLKVALFLRHSKKKNTDQLVGFYLREN